MSFEGCWAKIQRAKEHRDALDGYVRQTFAVKENRPRFGCKFDTKTREHVLRITHKPDLGEFFARASLIVGDAIHNLRAGLDHLVFELARQHTGEDIRRPRDLSFPITESSQAWENSSRAVREIAPAHRAVIERYQGYHRVDQFGGGGAYEHPLVTLRELDDTDKHRLLNTIVIPTNSLEFDPAFFPGVFMVMVFGLVQQSWETGRLEIKPAELGTEIARFRIDEGGPIQPDVDVAGYVAPEVGLRKSGLAIPLLDRIAAVVVKVLREFDPVP